MSIIDLSFSIEYPAKLTFSFAKLNTQMNWDDLRVILAIFNTGTLTGAARSLRISHTTVYRRLGEIEKRMGVKLFERSRVGYKPTIAGEEIAISAGHVESEILEIERRIIGQDLRVSGSIRVTTTDSLMVGLLSPIFSAFLAAYSDINLEISISNDLYSLSKREADVAIRPSTKPPESLVGPKVAVINQAVYSNNPNEAGQSSSIDLRSLSWIGPDESMFYSELEKWMFEQELTSSIRYQVNSVLGMCSAVRDGVGVAVLPCYLADESLYRVGNPISTLTTNLWLLTHMDLNSTARIRVFMMFVADAVKKSERLRVN